MRYHFLPVILAALAPFHLQGQMPPELVKAERAKILAGVTSLPKTGAPGPIAIWGNIAFPLLSAASGREANELAVAAAAGHGKGRIILFGHNSYLDGNAGGDHAKLMENCATWAGNKAKPRIGLKGVNATAFFDKLGFKAESFSDITEKTLGAYDVILLNAQNVTDATQGSLLTDWVKNGGGLIAGMTGWAFSQTSGGKDLAVSHGLNQALMPAGVAFTDMSAFDGLNSFQARADLPALMNASEAIQAIKKQSSGGNALTPDEVKQSSSAIQVALAAQPPDRSNLRDAVTAALGETGKNGVVPTKTAPLTQAQHAAERIRLGMETRVLRLAASEKAAPHPAHEAFPGKAPADAPRITSEVKIDPAIPGWTSTGLYAAAGETITVTVPEAIASKGYAVRIGCHSDTLYHLDTWSRAPDICKTAPLNAATTQIASAFGGLVYIEVPGRATEGEVFAATLQDGIAAPLFVLGQDDDAKWNSEIKKRPAPWAELACDKMILSVPTEVAKLVTTPTLLMQFWKQVVEAQDDISNQTSERKRPERMVADVQISAGFMHSGYPIMLHVPEALEMVTYNRIKFPGWGYHHEIGHNHQRGHFTFEGTGEVTNNVLGMYVYEAVLKKDWLIGHSAITPERRKENLVKIKLAADKWTTWKGDPFLALHTYIQLVQAFGWESWRAYLYSFSDAKFGPMPQSDDDKRDQFLVRYSKIVNRNLGPFFEAWGIPVSPEAKAEVSKLESWMPAEM